MLTFVFVSLSFSVTGLHAFTVAVANPSVKVKENEGVDLKCIYSADFGATPRIEWKFKDLRGSQSFIYFDNKPTVQYENRISVYNGGLRLEKVTRADTGDYDCEVSGQGGYDIKTIKLTVLVPPSKPVSKIPSSVTTGSNVLLTCFDNVGSPPPTYKWYKDNTPLPDDPSMFPTFKNLTYKMNVFNGNLEFPSVSKLDIGSYFCEASNGEGAPQRGDAVRMEVRLHAFTVTVANPSVKVKENEGVDLKCTYSGDFGATPRIEWKFKDLKGSQSFIYFDNKPTAQYENRIIVYNEGLRFNKVTRADTGDYDCEVSANGGYDEKTIKLTVLVPPSKPVSRIPSSVTTGSNVLLTCFDNVGSPPPTYKWYKDNTPLPDDPSKFPTFKNLTYKMNVFNGNLEFPSVSKMDIGSYFCEANNGEGAPQRSDAVKMDVRRFEENHEMDIWKTISHTLRINGDLNVGGIVAGVIVALLAVGLLLFALWFASKKGYMPKMKESKPKTQAVYTQPRSDEGDGDGEFRQKSSFVV